MHRMFCLSVAAAAAVASTPAAPAEPVGAAATIELQARPAAVLADLRRRLPPRRVAPLPPAIKLQVLRQGGIVVRDLPVGPPHVTVARPVDQGLSLSYYGIFAADAGLDYAEFRDRQGFVALNWPALPQAIYLVDCELPGGSAATKVDAAVDGGSWTPVAVSADHLVFAVPAIPDVPGYAPTHAFAIRSTGSGFHGCEVSKVK